jgi:hypothetical protein
MAQNLEVFSDFERVRRAFLLEPVSTFRLIFFPCWRIYGKQIVLHSHLERSERCELRLRDVLLQPGCAETAQKKLRKALKVELFGLSAIAARRAESSCKFSEAPKHWYEPPK